jgi:hypothetical protein
MRTPNGNVSASAGFTANLAFDNMKAMDGKRDRHPRNTEGPFYVESGQCISCGAPESEAAGLISHDESGHCFFARQPIVEDETSAAIRGVWASCCGAVRYGGDDRQILIRLSELGSSSQCDHQAPPGHPQRIRNWARFEYSTPRGVFSKRASLRRIIDEIAGSVGKLPGSQCFEFRCWFNAASFRLRWGKYGSESGHTVRFDVVHESADQWLLRVSGNEVAHTSFAIQLDKALQAKTEFRNVRWFDANEWPIGGDRGKRSPY